MAIVIAAAVLATGLIAAALLYTRSVRPAAASIVPDPVPVPRDDVERELLERRAEIARIEERAITRKEAIAVNPAELARRDRTLDDRGRQIDGQHELLDERKREHIREL